MVEGGGRICLRLQCPALNAGAELTRGLHPGAILSSGSIGCKFWWDSLAQPRGFAPDGGQTEYLR